MPKIHPVQRVRRVRRVFDLLSSVSLNQPSPYDQPYTSQMTKGVTGPRVF